MSAQPIVGAFAHKLAPAVTFKAWTVAPECEGNARHEACPRAWPEWCETAEQIAAHLAGPHNHKSSIMVLRSDAAARPERRNLVTMFVVKRKTRPGWVRGPDGKTVREQPEYADFVTKFCVHDGFEPVRPWRVEDGNPAGHDLTLVEG